MVTLKITNQQALRAVLTSRASTEHIEAPSIEKRGGGVRHERAGHGAGHDRHLEHDG